MVKARFRVHDNGSTLANDHILWQHLHGNGGVFGNISQNRTTYREVVEGVTGSCRLYFYSVSPQRYCDVIAERLKKDVVVEGLKCDCLRIGFIVSFR